MENNYKSPKEITEGYLQAGIYKSKKATSTLIVMGILAGMFIAIGASASMVASHGISNYGLAKFTAGAVFPVGLIMIIILGAELFTGDCMMVFGVWDKKYSYMRMWRTLTIIWLSNMIGAVIIAFIAYYSAQFDISYGALGAYVIKNAVGKASTPAFNVFVSGIGCNIVVCAAMLIAYGANDITGKIAGAYITIMAFIVTGFEHCIANMYYLTAGILAANNETYVSQAEEIYHLSAEQISVLTVGGAFHNIIPATLGNIVGGMLFIALPLYVLYIDKKAK